MVQKKDPFSCSIFLVVSSSLVGIARAVARKTRVYWPNEPKQEISIPVKQRKFMEWFQNFIGKEATINSGNSNASR